MEILYIMGVFFLICLVLWIVDEVRSFLEIRRYKKKLKRLAPQLQAIDISTLLSRLTETKETYHFLVGLLQEKHMFSSESEPAKTVYDYVREEAKYRRSNRKPTKTIRRRKREGWRRYY